MRFNHQEGSLMRVNLLSCILTLTAYFLSGCATERYIAPTISGSPRIGISLEKPILGAVFDGRANKEPKNAASILQRDLSQLYGTSIKWGDYFTEIPKGRVGLRIRIVMLGAKFGSRLFSSVAFVNAVESAQGQASGPWGAVVASASADQSSVAGSFSGEGWWNGVAWIDVEIQDCRGQKAICFVLPIVAEDREANMWGYASGDKAVRTSWERASEQLTRVMDAVLRTVRDEE
jgi:hypothetical protein